MSKKTSGMLYQVKAAKSTKKMRSLINDDFEYVCDFEGVKIFRKWRVRPLLKENRENERHV